jgi:two-component system, LuxR family, sensor kinase FixL
VFVDLYRKRRELAQANERLRAESAERERAQEQALQAERLAAIGQMVAGLAHESRNSLQQMHAAAAMLARRLRDGPESSLVGEINMAHDRLHDLLEAVRAYAMPLKLNREDDDLAKLWRAAWDGLAHLRQGRVVRFLEDAGERAARCWVDGGAMVRLFRILLKNSLEACADPAMIEVRCRPAHLGGQPALRVEIADDGTGLTDEQRQRLFEPFYTTKIRGTGLGLACARRIVQAHGGQMAVRAGPSRGTEIEVLLPKGPT